LPIFVSKNGLTYFSPITFHSSLQNMVVVRFAPSPTGPLHVGGVRTALYNYLFAKRHGGKFILRIEDTDQTRFVAGAEAYIRESLKWCGLIVDEGVEEGGPHAPYRQSERSELYAKYTKQLLDNGQAYIAFDTAEEIDALRKTAEAAGNKGWQYGCETRMSLTNSLTLSKEEVAARIASGAHYAVRLLVPENENVHFIDEIRGDVTIHTSKIDDKVLMKSDGLPTYHLANVVDDHLMEVTHVVRGDEWLPSGPLHILLYRAFGWTPPKFAHLPLILRPDGNGKLSKRDGDKLGVPVFPLNWNDVKTNELTSGFREAGYLPHALINFLALQGWNPGTEEEVMSLDRLAELFSIEKIGNSGTKFDLEKLRWFNQTYIKATDAAEMLPFVKTELTKQGYQVENYSDDFIKGAINLMKERVIVLPDFVTNAPYLYKMPVYDATFMAKQWHEAGKQNLGQLAEIWENIAEADWTAENLQNSLHDFTQNHNVPNGKILPQLRLALTGVSGGPDSIALAALLGKKETLVRFNALVSVIN
jgi:glutamyl-tRNA synthetase